MVVQTWFGVFSLEVAWVSVVMAQAGRKFQNMQEAYVDSKQ